MGSDYEAYRGHVLRVKTYAMHFLNNPDRYADFKKAISMGLAYHDIALWTDHTLAYLEPSRDRAARDMVSFNEEEKELVQNIIYWHHKITPFEGPNADIVNAIRKADWIDASQGLIHQGMPKKHILKTVKAIPYAGFHNILMGFGSKLYGNDFVRIVSEISSIYKL